MKTSPVTAADLQRSVIAVPPLARHADLSLNLPANRALLRHLEEGACAMSCTAATPISTTSQ